jgi:hypothetical protein
MVDGIDGAIGGEGVGDQVEGVISSDVEVEGGGDFSCDACRSLPA